jgi:hypothetical protein
LKKYKISIIIVVCSLLLATGIIVLSLLFNGKNEKNKQSVTSSGIILIDTEEQVNIKFYDCENNVVKEEIVNLEGMAVPPEISELKIPENRVFKGFQGDFINVRADTDILPVTQDFSKAKNCFYFNTMYVPKDSIFNISLNLGGMVNISDFAVELPYSVEELEYITATSNVGEVTQDNGVIKLTVNGNINTSGSVMNITFKAIMGNFTYSELKPQIIVKNADYQIISAEIYQYNKGAENEKN